MPQITFGSPLISAQVCSGPAPELLGWSRQKRVQTAGNSSLSAAGLITPLKPHRVLLANWASKPHRQHQHSPIFNYGCEGVADASKKRREVLRADVQPTQLRWLLSLERCRAYNKSVYGGYAGSTGGKIPLCTSNGFREPRRECVCDGSGPPWHVGQGPGSGLEFCGGTLPGWHLPPPLFCSLPLLQVQAAVHFPR